MTQVQQRPAEFYTPSSRPSGQHEELVTITFSDKHLFESRPLVVGIQKGTDGDFAFLFDTELRKMSTSLGLGQGMDNPNIRWISANYVVADALGSGIIPTHEPNIPKLIEMVRAEVCRVRRIAGNTPKMLH